jgi:hypothetical protein
VLARCHGCSSADANLDYWRSPMWSKTNTFRANVEASGARPWLDAKQPGPRPGY